MKTMLKTPFIGLILLLCSCSDFTKEQISNETATDEQTRTEQIDYGGNSIMNYYWCEGEKIPLTIIDTKSYIIFSADNKDKLVNSLYNRDVPVELSNVNQYLISTADNKSLGLLSNCLTAEIDVNYKDLIGVEEIIYATPFVRNSQGQEFPPTNIVYVCLKNADDYSLLLRVASENNLEIIDKIDSLPLWYELACTDKTKNYSINIANQLCESGLFAAAAPSFKSIVLAE